MVWTVVLCRRFESNQGRIAEVNLRGKVFTVVLLTVFRLAGSTATAQEKQSVINTLVSVKAEDLLAQPVAANWTSYNGDYSGRRYSSLREINAENVARLLEVR